MQSRVAPHATSSSALLPPSGVNPGSAESSSCSPERIAPSTPEPIYLLSVGRIEPATHIRKALLDLSDVGISIVTDYRELWMMTTTRQAMQIVLLNNSLCSFELEEAARLIRIRWPKAKVLIIRSGELSLDHGLYDERLHTPVTTEVLVEQISRLANLLHEEEYGCGNR